MEFQQYETPWTDKNQRLLTMCNDAKNNLTLDVMHNFTPCFHVICRY